VIAIFGGHVAWIVLAWIASGMLGVMYRLFLLRKYRDDLGVSVEARSSYGRIRVSKHAIEATLRHIVIDLLVITIGIPVAIEQWHDPNANLSLNIGTLAILAIPWLLMYDGLREFDYQRWLLHHAGEPPPEMLAAGTRSAT
jgi:hypothetical protein